MQRDQAHRTNELLERIAVALEKNNKQENGARVLVDEIGTNNINEIPGFEGTLNDLDNLYHKDKSYECCDDNTPCSCNPDYVHGCKNDEDNDIRSTAYSYEAAIDEDLHTKKDCILDYVTNEFGTFGARYTDIIKLAYYLGSPNAPKYTSANRGYYAMAFAPRYGGHLIQGGKDQLVKGINNEGDERYFALSFVESATEYYKRLDV